MKLEITHLAPYLPYGLKFKDLVNNEIYELDTENLSGVVEDAEHLNSIKPLLLPMSSLYTEMEDGTVPIVEIAREMGLKFVRYDLSRNCVDLYLTDRKGKKARFWYDGFKTDTFRLTIYGSNSVNQLIGFTYLFSHHFDVFSLIDNGLAIDKTKIK